MSAAFRTAEAVFLGVATVAAGEVAWRYQTGAQWLIVVGLGTGFVVALCATAGAVFGAVRRLVAAAPQRRAADAYTPPDHPLWPLGTGPDPATAARDAYIVREYADEYAAAARHARREAERPTHDGLTQPMPDVTRAAWSGVVADPSSLPWTAPVAGPVGRAS